MVDNQTIHSTKLFDCKIDSLLSKRDIREVARQVADLLRMLICQLPERLLRPGKQDDIVRL